LEYYFLVIAFNYSDNGIGKNLFEFAELKKFEAIQNWILCLRKFIILKII
jgi:hypothetical protein